MLLLLFSRISFNFISWKVISWPDHTFVLSPPTHLLVLQSTLVRVLNAFQQLIRREVWRILFWIGAWLERGGQFLEWKGTDFLEITIKSFTSPPLFDLFFMCKLKDVIFYFIVPCYFSITFLASFVLLKIFLIASYFINSLFSV